MMSVKASPDRRRFAPGEYFLLRTPLLPADTLLEWFGSDPGANSGWDSRLVQLRGELRRLLEQPEIRNALFVASRSVHQAASAWLHDPGSRQGRKTERALVRYFQRMTTRCTPFGLFSGCSAGVIDADRVDSTLELSGRPTYRRVTRLDFGYLFELTAALRRLPSLSSRLTFSPNTSLARRGDAWHYTETRGDTRASRHLVRLAADEFLDAVIRAADGGARFETLVNAVQVTDASISLEEAEAYVAGLVDNDVLTTSLEPPLTGPDALRTIADELRRCDAPDAADAIAGIAAVLRQTDSLGLAQDTLAYAPLESELRKLPVSIPDPPTLQVDLFKPADARLGTALVCELERALAFLDRIADSTEPYALRRFRDAFVRRYERSWVALLDALDEDAGIGFWNGTDEGTHEGEDAAGGEFPTALTRLESLLLHKLAGRRAPMDEVTIDDSDIEELPNTPHHRREGFEVLATVIGDPARGADGRTFDIVLRLVSGPPGGRISARFCHLDASLDRSVRSAVREDELEDPDAIYAEVVHVPQARLGNIVQRPVLREYEIPYLARSGASLDRILPAADLLVSVAEDGTILLYSKRLRKRVIPRLTNAHGFLKPTLPAVYRFLCHLQMQGIRGVGFHWGRLSTLPFLPRVRIGRTILACARWRLARAEVERLRQTDTRQVHAAVQEIRHARGLPRYVALVEGEDSLVVDLENPLSIDAFAALLSGKDSAVVEEQLPALDQLCVVGPEGHFCNEIVVPFQRVHVEARQPPAVAAALATAACAVPASVRLSPPGSAWVYLKLYGNHAALEAVLTRRLAPALRDLVERGVIEKWFFVRYGDPDTHLRVRMHVRSPSTWHDALSRALEACREPIDDGRIWKVQLDTYQREIERYGGTSGMDLAEGVFWADSDALIEILEALQMAAAPQRWAAAACGIDRLIAACEPDVGSACALVRRFRDAFSASARKDGETRRRLAALFRERRQILMALRSGAGRQDSLGVVLKTALDRRAQHVDAAVARLKALHACGLLLQHPEQVLGTIAHMHFNRVYRRYDRFEELATYDSLGLLYEGLAARAARQQDAAVAASVAVPWL